MRFVYAGQPNNVCCDPVIYVDPESHAVLTTPATGGSPQEVVVVPSESSTTPSSFAIREASEDMVVAAGQRPFVQNLGTSPLFVKLGTGASASSFNFILNAATAEDNGTGGATPKDGWPLDGFVGTVSFFSTDFRYVAWVR